jgi:hypothetical protein
MKLELNNREITLFSNLAKGADGEILKKFLERIEMALIDIRNIPDQNVDIEKKARTLAVNIIKENITDRLKVLNGEIEPPNEDDYA